MLEKLNREDFFGMTPEEVAKQLQQKEDEYNEYIDGLSLEEKKAEEERIIKLAQEWDEELDGISYELEKTCTFQGSAPVSKTTVGKYICEFLEKIECEYSYTLGYWQLYTLWQKPGKEISYKNLNATLTVLGSGLRFKGPHQWQMILVINEYFKPLHNQYMKDNMLTFLYGKCHSNLMDRMKIEDPDAANKTEEFTDGQVIMEGPVA